MTKSLSNIQNGGIHWLNKSQNLDLLIAITFLFIIWFWSSFLLVAWLNKGLHLRFTRFQVSFLREAGQIEDISIQVHDMKADTADWGIAKVMSHRRNQKPRQPEYHERVESVEYCKYCGLTRAHPRGKHCPAYGTQCNICKKFNHFSSVCRENVIEEAIMGQRSPMRYSQKKKPCIKRAEEVDQSSDTSSDEDFIENSLMHMRIKTVSESTAEKKDNISSRDIQILQGKVSRLENELWLVKNHIQDLLTRQKNKELLWVLVSGYLQFGSSALKFCLHNCHYPV